MAKKTVKNSDLKDDGLEEKKPKNITSKPFLKGNKFWEKRTKHGVDRIFKDANVLWEECCKYFESVIENPILVQEMTKMGPQLMQKQRPITYEGLCNYLGVGVKYFWDAERLIENKTSKSKEDLDLSDVYARVRQTIRQYKYEGALVGIFNGNLIAKEFGMADTVKQEVTSEVKATVTSESKVQVLLPDNSRGNVVKTEEKE